MNSESENQLAQSQTVDVSSVEGAYLQRGRSRVRSVGGRRGGSTQGTLGRGRQRGSVEERGERRVRGGTQWSCNG